MLKIGKNKVKLILTGEKGFVNDFTEHVVFELYVLKDAREF